MNMKNVNLSNVAEAIRDHGVEILTQTRLNSMHTCLKRHWFRYERGLVPTSTKTRTLDFGLLGHECTEMWHRPTPPNEEPMSLEERRRTILALIDSNFDNRDNDPEQKEDWHYSLAMMKAYMAKYDPFDEPFEIMAVEIPAVGPIVNPRTNAVARKVAFAMKADALVRMKDTGAYALLERKTAQKTGNSYFDKLQRNFQITGYSLYLEQQENIQISSVIYDVLKKPSITQHKGETELEFQERLRSKIESSKSGTSKAKRKIGETDDEFQIRLAEFYSREGSLHREQIFIDKREYEEVQLELWQMAQLYLHLRRQKAWPRNRDACYPSVGYKCGYIEPCSAPPGQQEQMIEIFLKHEPPHRELADILGLRTNDGGSVDGEPNVNANSDTNIPTINDDAAILREQMASNDPNSQVDFWGDF